MGRRLGRMRWSQSGKTVEGSVAFFASVMVSSALLWVFGTVQTFNVSFKAVDLYAYIVKAGPYALATALATLLEAFSAQNDNLILPMYGWAIGTLFGV